MKDGRSGERRPKAAVDREGADDEVLASIAYLYYIKDMTQEEIASELGMSRFKVLRLLRESRRRGIVRIEVSSPIGECIELEHGLMRLGLADAVVAPLVDGASDETMMDAIGAAAARLLRRKIVGDVRVGIAWGRTVSHVVKAMREMGPREGARVTVVQLMGGVGELDHTISSTKLGSDLAAIYGGQCYFVHAPAIVESADLCQRLREEPSIRQTLDLARSVDIALVGVGRADEESGLVQGKVLSPDDVAAIAREGAQGSICASFFDSEGRECSHLLSRRVIGISLDDFKAVPTRILVAGGASKVGAILGALRGGLVNVLVTDRVTARLLLEKAGVPVPGRNEPTEVTI